MGLEDRQYYRNDSGTYSNFSLDRYSIVTILVIINVAIFLLDAFTPELNPNGDGTHWLSHFLGIKQTHPWFIWNYLTYGFAHASYSTSTSFWHVAGNMIVLWFLGRPVEYTLGRSEFLRFYLISIVVSGVGFTVLRDLVGSDFDFLVGASGGVTAVLALFIFMFPKQTILLMGIIPMPAWLLGVLILVQNLFTAFNPASHTAWEAHLLGGAFGVVYYLQRWNFSRLQFGNLGNLFKSRPKLKVHQPDRGSDKLKEAADEILQKINDRGEDSLTPRERKTLNKYSQQLRKNRGG
jgi:membrane associated rhomboid family serine protease